jgi:hypothetical protein
MASTTAQNYEQSGGGTPHQVRGLHQVVIGDAVATRTLAAKESGALCLMDSAAGVVYTLPPPVLGMTFSFLTTVTDTSNSHKIITNAAGVFLLGEVGVAVTGAGDVDYFAFNGTTHIACLSNGTTSGGAIGGLVTVTAISATQWLITGTLVGSGTQVTPASTT